MSGDFARTHFVCPDAKFTPGPWAIKGPSLPSADTPEGGDFAIVAGGQIIGEAFRRTGSSVTQPAHYNARLMATAPMLFAITLEMEAYCWARMLDAADEDDKTDHDIWHRLHELCIAGIENVTGQPFRDSRFIPPEGT